jgi:nucleoside-diphosphate-sugar epimerase
VSDLASSPSNEYEQSSDPEPKGLCLITGATGFIGGRLAARLAQAGHPVRALARRSSDTSQLEQLDNVEIASGDLADASSLAKAAVGCELVFHCAALVSDWATVEEIKRINVVGTRSLLNACMAASVKRLIHISTTDVYGHPDTRGSVDESYTSPTFSNWYAQSKLEAEAEVRRAGEQGLEAVILRPATVYGPGSREVIGEIARAIRSRNMLLVDRGRADAGLCYVENLIDALLIASRHESAPGQVFNISDGLTTTWRELVDDLAAGLGAPRVRWSLPYGAAAALGLLMEHGYRLLRRTTGLSAPPLLSRQAVQVLGRNQSFSNRKAGDLLGWEPRIGYRAGLEETLDWLRTSYLQPT